MAAPSPYAKNNPYATIYRGYKSEYTPPQGPSPNAKNNPYATVYRGFQNNTKAGQMPFAPPKPGGSGTKTTAAGNPYDYSGDPILQQVLGQNLTQRSMADQTLFDQQRKALLGFGSAEVAKRLFGGDTAFVDAVASNPFSVLGQIKNLYEGRSGLINQANESLNNQNLFFSSERLSNQLPQLYRSRLGAEYGAAQDLQNTLDQLEQSRMGVYNQTVSSEIQARQDAAARAVQAALASGYGPGAKSTAKPIAPPVGNGWQQQIPQSASNLIAQKGW